MFWTIARRRDVVVRAAKTAALVGVLLIAINHWDALLAGDVDSLRVAKMLLTFLVPYSVSTYAAVKAIQAVESSANQSNSRPR
jgi:hypothetical protein